MKMKSVSPNNCVSPIKYFIEYVDYYLANNPGSSISDVLDQITIAPFSADICTDILYDDGTYVLYGDLSLVELLTNTDPIMDNGPIDLPFGRNVCQNIFAVLKEDIFDSDLYSNNNDLKSEFLQPISCCTDRNNFTNCVFEALEYFQSNELFDWIFNDSQKGIFEYNSAKNTFCELFDLLKDKPQNVALDYLMTILEKGLLISRFAGYSDNANGIIFTSVQTYYDTYITP